MDYYLKHNGHYLAWPAANLRTPGRLHPRHNLMCHKRAAGSRFSKLRHIQKRARHGTVLPVEGTHDSARTGQPNSGSLAPAAQCSRATNVPRGHVFEPRHIQKRARHGAVLPVEGTHNSARTGRLSHRGGSRHKSRFPPRLPPLPPPLPAAASPRTLTHAHTHAHTHTRTHAHTRARAHARTPATMGKDKGPKLPSWLNLKQHHAQWDGGAVSLRPDVTSRVVAPLACLLQIHLCAHRRRAHAAVPLRRGLARA